MIICPRCQAQNQDNAPWCYNCGLTFSQHPLQPSQSNPGNYPQQPPIQTVRSSQREQFSQDLPVKTNSIDPTEKPKKKRNFWKMYGIAMSVLSLLLLIALGSSGGSDQKSASIQDIPQAELVSYCIDFFISQPNDNIPSPMPENTVALAVAPAANEKHHIGDTVIVDKVYSLQVTRIELAKNYEGKDAITIYYQFTNNGDKAQSFGMTIANKPFQNGIECEWVTDPDLNDNFMTEIQPGASIEIKRTYFLHDLTTPVELELTPLISFNPTPIVFEIPI